MRVLTKEDMNKRESVGVKIEKIEGEILEVLKDFSITSKDLDCEKGYSKFFYSREDIPENVKKNVKELFSKIIEIEKGI